MLAAAICQQLLHADGEEVEVREPERRRNGESEHRSGRDGHGNFGGAARVSSNVEGGISVVIKFLLWCVLFILCWPVALFALVLYPIVWLLLLPFRLLGIAVHGALDLVAALIFLPGRLLRAA